MRRTVTLPEGVDRRVRELAHEGESFSAAVTRLLEAGARAAEGAPVPSYIGMGEGGPDDLGIDAERYLREIFADPDFRH